MPQSKQLALLSENLLSRHIYPSAGFQILRHELDRVYVVVQRSFPNAELHRLRDRVRKCVFVQTRCVHSQIDIAVFQMTLLSKKTNK